MKPIDKLVLKTAMRLFLMFVISGKAPRGLSLILWLEGSITTLEKTIDLAWNKIVKYNIVSKGDSPSKAMQELSLLMYCMVSYLLLLLYILI